LKTFNKITATLAATALLLAPGLAAMADDQPDPILLGAPAPQWITVADLQATANYKRVEAAEKKSIANILKSKNVDLKINEVITAVAPQTGKVNYRIEELVNKTSGRYFQKVTSTGKLTGPSATIDCGYAHKKYFAPLAPTITFGGRVSLKQALAAMKASTAKRAYDPKSYRFTFGGNSCATDPHPAKLLAAITSGNYSLASVINPLILASTNQVQAMSVTKAKGAVKTDAYLLVGNAQNPESPETGVSFTATFFVNPKSATLQKFTVDLLEPGMGFNINLSYEYAKTSAVSTGVATDHAVSAAALAKAGNTLAAKQFALSQAKALASAANAAGSKSHKPATKKSVATLAKSRGYKTSLTRTGLKINYSMQYKATLDASKFSTATGHACVSVVHGKASAKACN
jgi:hypothetical protein